MDLLFLYGLHFTSQYLPILYLCPTYIMSYALSFLSLKYYVNMYVTFFQFNYTIDSKYICLSSISMHSATHLLCIYPLYSCISFFPQIHVFFILNYFLSISTIYSSIIYLSDYLSIIFMYMIYLLSSSSISLDSITGLEIKFKIKFCLIFIF